VVAAQHRVPQRLHAVPAGKRVGRTVHDVAQHKDAVEPQPFYLLQHRLEGRQVPMDIRKYRNAHPPFLPRPPHERKRREGVRTLHHSCARLCVIAGHLSDPHSGFAIVL